MKLRQLFLAAFGLALLAACEPTMHPDYAIRVTPTPAGGIAAPPDCPSWATATADPMDNQPVPQYGCADARDLAMQVEKPNDLVHARSMGDARGVTTVGAIRRYDNNQPRGLITTGSEVNQSATTTAPSSASPMTGDVTGAAPAASSSSSAAAASP